MTEIELRWFHTDGRHCERTIELPRVPVEGELILTVHEGRAAALAVERAARR